MSELTNELRKLKSMKDATLMHLDLAQKVSKLRSSPEFKEIIEEGFLKENALRCISLASSGRVMGEAKQDAIQEAMASGYLDQYLSRLEQLGSEAAKTVEELEDAILEIEREIDYAE